MKTRIPIGIKVILYQVFFLVIHYLYDWFPGGFSYFLGATNESVFQHMKAGFYAYIALTVFEVLVATSSSTFLLEDLIERSELSPGLKGIIVLLFTLTAIQCVIFTYRLPWFDVFAIPPGW